MKIFHIVLPEVWKCFEGKPFYEADSLRSEGFIHCSFANQLETVLNRYYQGMRKVLILEIDSDALTSRYVEEPSTNDEIYPHIYGAINVDAVIGVKERNS